MHVAMISADGGARPLAEALHQLGHQVSLYADATDLPSDDPPDVVHAFAGLADAVAYREKTGAPVVATPAALAAGGVPAADVDRIVAPTAVGVPALLQAGAVRTQIQVVPPGIDVDFFQPGPDGPGSRTPDRPARVLCVAGPGGAGLADAVGALRRVPGAQLIVEGINPSATPGRVHWLGDVPLERRPALFRSVDVFLGTAPAGMTPVEAMACGTPVIAYAQGEVADQVAHGVTGTLVEPGDVASLAVALRDLLDFEPRRYAYGAAGVSRVRARHAWPLVAEQIEAVYQSVVSLTEPDSASA
ncbi:glycosyltransferase family 4 protein [Hamadaea tsunoensis]|uniref:glycosyltransferase family 4 protein n=1 Tax=Hamadaea tsunoensis TaxID=53368 RepID=UPI00040EEB14|nr:glycosyltransferase family 4 protein [Hamadaea tsunoensis]